MNHAHAGLERSSRSVTAAPEKQLSIGGRARWLRIIGWRQRAVPERLFGAKFYFPFVGIIPNLFGSGIASPRPRRAHEWPAQVVLVLGAVAIAAVVFVFGLLVGAGIAPMVGG
jgi:hypothetical protein